MSLWATSNILLIISARMFRSAERVWEPFSSPPTWSVVPFSPRILCRRNRNEQMSTSRASGQKRKNMSHRRTEGRFEPAPSASIRSRPCCTSPHSREVYLTSIEAAAAFSLSSKSTLARMVIVVFSGLANSSSFIRFVFMSPA